MAPAAMKEWTLSYSVEERTGNGGTPPPILYTHNFNQIITVSSFECKLHLIMLHIKFTASVISIHKLRFSLLKRHILISAKSNQYITFLHISFSIKHSTSQDLMLLQSRILSMTNFSSFNLETC